MKSKFLIWPLLLVVPACSLTPVDSHVRGYLTTPAGALLKNSEGQCWRTAEWRPELAIAECDPELVRQRRARGLPVFEATEVPEPEPEPDRTAVVAARAQTEQPAPETAVPSQRVRDALPEAALLPTLTLTENRPLSLSGDATFHFGHHRLTPRGRESLEYLVFAIRRQQVRDLRIDITGHSDRIGNRAENLVLSQRRADTVRDALIEMGIDPAVITATGKGSSEPVTTLEDCPTDLVRCELIGCLAPDRRVEVKVSGIRDVKR